MKFTQTLRLQTKEEWSSYYLHYKKLHQLINRIVFAYQSGSLEQLSDTKIRHNPYQEPRAFSLLPCNSSITDNDSDDESPEGVDRLYSAGGDDDDDDDDDDDEDITDNDNDDNEDSQSHDDNDRDRVGYLSSHRQKRSGLRPKRLNIDHNQSVFMLDHMDLDDNATVDSIGLSSSSSLLLHPSQPLLGDNYRRTGKYPHQGPDEQDNQDDHTCSIPLHQHYGTLETQHGQNIAQHQRIRYQLSSQSTAPYFTHLLSQQQRHQQQHDRFQQHTKDDHVDVTTHPRVSADVNSETTSKTGGESTLKSTTKQHKQQQSPAPQFLDLLSTFPKLKEQPVLSDLTVDYTPRDDGNGDGNSGRGGGGGGDHETQHDPSQSTTIRIHTVSGDDGSITVDNSDDESDTSTPHDEHDDVFHGESVSLLSPTQDIKPLSKSFASPNSTNHDKDDRSPQVGISSSVSSGIRPNLSLSSLTSLFKSSQSNSRAVDGGSHHEPTGDDSHSIQKHDEGNKSVKTYEKSSTRNKTRLKNHEVFHYLDMYETSQSEFFFTLFSDMNRVNTFYLQMASELCSKLDAVLLEPDVYAHRAPFLNVEDSPAVKSFSRRGVTNKRAKRNGRKGKGARDGDNMQRYHSATSLPSSSPPPSQGGQHQATTRTQTPHTLTHHHPDPIGNQDVHDYRQASYQLSGVSPSPPSPGSGAVNTDGAIHHTISHHDQRVRDTLVHDDHQYHSILSTYEQICELKQFCQLNTTGFMKILLRYSHNQPQRLSSQGKRVGINNRLVKVAFQELRGCDFVKHDKLHRLTTMCYNVISRDKLLSIEHTVRTQRKDEQIAKTHGLYVTIKWTPLLVSLFLFFVILLLPLDLVSDLRIRYSPNPLYMPDIKPYLNPLDDQTYTLVRSKRHDAILPIRYDKATSSLLATSTEPILAMPVTLIERNAIKGTDLDGHVVAPQHQSDKPNTREKHDITDIIGATPLLEPLDDPKYRLFIKNHPRLSSTVVPNLHEYKLGKPLPDTTKYMLPGSPQHYEVYLSHVNTQAHKCLGLLTLAVLLWVTESVPYFCTALIIPIVAVLLGISYDDDGLLLSAKQAAAYLPTRFFSQTSTLILLGFTLSAAFSKAQLEMRLISFFHSYFGHNPYYFILSITLLGWFMSLWLNNKSAHLICMAFLMPVMNEVGSKTRFTKALLLSLTLGCNIGGAGSPIASLQNVLAVSALSSIDVDITFLQWLAVSIPFSLVSIGCIFALIVTLVPPTDVTSIPVIMYKRQSFSSTHYVVIASSAVTILALVFLSSNLIVNTVGGISTIAFCYMAFIFSTNVLSVFDFNSYAWHLIMLIGGGSVLGECIKHSQLMNIIAESLLVSLPFTFSRYIVYAQLIFVVLVMTSFISHTVGALILMPLLLQIGIEMGMPVMVCISSALAINVAMMLPFSSFPNLNAISCRNESGEPYLDSMMDLIVPGTILSFVCYFIIISLGYGLILLFM